MKKETFKHIHGLAYDDAEHEYFYEGRKVAGVTTALEVSGLSDFSCVDSETLTRAMNFGTAVHSVTEFDDKGILGDYDPKLEPALFAWRKFKKDLKVELINAYIELKVFSKKFLYAGTLDRILLIAGVHWLIDIKTGGRMPSHPIQSAAYETAFREIFKFRKKIRRACVYLIGGKYRIVEHTSVLDWNIFLSALNITKYKKGVR